MKTVETIKQARDIIAETKRQGQKVGFVPTMGALHAGHLSLIKQARRRCGFVVVSIFVNPTQFSPNEDFDSYPRNLAADAEKCEKEGVDLIFAPSRNEMYPVQNRTWVTVEGRLTETLCGAARPGHFRGVTTVCTKLFNIIQPDTAFFGQKDAQQAAVIKAMAADTNLPLEIETCPIVREENGLAMSSRNKYLTDYQRRQAGEIYKSLSLCRQAYQQGKRDVKELKAIIEKQLKTASEIEIEYVEIVNAETFEKLETVNRPALAAVAVKLGEARLIDNIILD